MNPSASRRVALQVNGMPVSVEVEDRRLLSDALREDLGLTGTHVGCEHGVCGACTVLLDGEPARSCLIFAVQAQGASITTIEGLCVDGAMAPLQTAMQRAHSFQCGFCSPGILLTLHALLGEEPDPSAATVRSALPGNLCRCTGYESIVDGALLAANEARKATDGTVA